MWFRKAIYDDQSIVDLWRPVWLGAAFIFVLGTVVLTILYQVSQRRFVKGEQVRGTRKLTPGEYRKEHRKHTGYALTAYPQVKSLLARVQDYLISICARTSSPCHAKKRTKVCSYSAIRAPVRVRSCTSFWT
jgi:hypothetical protein